VCSSDLQHALDYAKTRVQGRAIGQRSGERVTIIHHPDVRRMLMMMKAQTEAMRALAYTASAALDLSNHHPDGKERRRNQALVDLLIPIVKGWCTESSIEVASTGIQIHGGMGFIEETGAAQFLRDARITTIYEGTTGIQAADLVGRKVGFEQGATAFAVIGEMRKLDVELARSKHADVAAQRDHLKHAVDGLNRATQWLVDTFSQNPNAIAAVSVPYLKLWGTVAGGWLMARAALIAEMKLSDGVGDADFFRAKIATARFYAEHILPQASGLASAVVNGAGSVLALAEAQF
jgi:acyl-CoA dehydrogenase